MKAADICLERRSYNCLAQCINCAGHGDGEQCQEWLVAWRENLQDCPADQLRESFIQAMRAEIDGRSFPQPEYRFPEPVGDTYYPAGPFSAQLRHLRRWAGLLGRRLLLWSGDDA